MPPARAATGGLSRRTVVLLFTALFVLGAASWYRLCRAELTGPVFEFAGETMGTTFDVKVAAEAMSPGGFREIGATVRAELDLVDERMSTWREDSELSRFNRYTGTDPFPMSAETLAVFRVAREVSELSSGAFDVTVAPLVAAWGFGAGARAPGGPDPAELASLRERVGWRRLELGPDSVRKTHPDTVCDLSAVAKGFAVDRVADALSARGLGAYLVEVGGELRARGHKLDGTPWRVAIEVPDGDREIHDVLALVDSAMATSGDYRNYYEQGGARISHTIDPRTGRPIRHGLASVTVVHPRAVWADALATALDVLGPEEGFALAEEKGWPAYFITREAGGGFASRETAAFAALRSTR